MTMQAQLVAEPQRKIEAPKSNGFAISEWHDTDEVMARLAGLDYPVTQSAAVHALERPDPTLRGGAGGQSCLVSHESGQAGIPTAG